MLSSPITHTTPTGNIPGAPELLTPCCKDKILVPNGVRYRGVPLYYIFNGIEILRVEIVLGCLSRALGVYCCSTLSHDTI